MPGPLTLGQIVARLGGRVAGDAETRVRQVASLEGATAEHISFFTGSRYREKLAATRAGAIVLGTEAEAETQLPRIVAQNPYAYFARVSIGALCVVGEGASIGDDSCLYPQVVVYPGCSIGARVILHSGAVIGADGFGIADDDGRWVKIPQIGAVRIGDDVEIGANTTIDRGAIDDTVIEEGVKLDNQIQVGHNVRIGAHTAIAGCAGIAGSADIGRHCTIGGAAVILGHLKIVDHVNISAGTLISRSILKPGTYTGVYPFDEHESWTRSAAELRRKGKKNG
jgi:UDP-3-O-[3-hydroxymyristoyl] glucosamine N-acyltransferase